MYKNKFDTWYFWMNFSILQMLYFDRIDVSEEIDLNKTNDQKSLIFVTGISLIIVLSFNQISAIDVMIY